MKHEMTNRVAYADTDQMGVVYYGNYLTYFERARTEMLRSVGLPYAEFERRGYLLPVSEAHCKYVSGAHYDDLLTFRSWLQEMRGARLTVACEVLRDGELLASGYVTLACVLAAERKLTRIPDFMREKCLCFLEDAEK